MRLGLMGPSDGDLDALARAAEFLLNTARVTRAVYLGADHALEHAVALWAEWIAGGDASDTGLWDRAFALAEEGAPDRIRAFVRAERARARLRSLEALPSSELRSAELLGDRLAILVYDGALLDEDDIFSASLIIYGKSDAPVFKAIGPRWFIAPGPITSDRGGVIVLDDIDEEIALTFHTVDGRTSRREALPSSRGMKLSVTG